MEDYIFDFTGLINYEVLAKYHFTAKMHLKTCLDRNEPVEVDFTHQVILKGNCGEEARQDFIAYFTRLNEFGIYYHASHIAYIIQKMVEFEGNFIEKDSDLHQYLKGNIEQLINILKLKEANLKNISVEFSDKSKIKDSNNYIILKQQRIVSAALDASACCLLNLIKEDESLIPFELIEEIRSLNELSLEKLTSLNARLIDVKIKAFRSELIYSICETLRRYLSTESPLKHETAFLTNDQARIIYDACNFYGLIDLNHEMDYEKINYIKAILNNKKGEDYIPINIQLSS